MNAPVTHRRRVFGPHVIKLAYFLRDSEVPPEEVIRFFEEVDRRWPNPSFHDFTAAALLCEALVMKTEGNA
jgi:hypothetical protein